MLSSEHSKNVATSWTVTLKLHFVSLILSLAAAPPRMKHGKMSNQREKRAAGEPYWAYSGELFLPCF